MPNETRVKPALGECGEVVLVDGVGVRLGGDLGAGGQAPGVAHRGEHGGEVGHGSRVGVPPPKKTVEATRGGSPARSRICLPMAISAIAWPA